MIKTRVLLLCMAFGLFVMAGCDSAKKEKNSAPNLPSSPTPADGATNVDINPTFFWTGGDPDEDVVTYEFLVLDDFGSGFAGTTTSESIGLSGSLDYSTHYQWQILATDGKADTVNGPIWEFNTMAPPIVTLLDHGFESSAGIIPGTFWNSIDQNGASGDDYWGDQQSPTARVHGGSWSAYSADNSDVVGQVYDNNMDAWLWNDFSPINISGYSNVEISFWMWYNTESGFDPVRFLYWTGSTWAQFSGGVWSGNQSLWTQYTFDVPTGASSQFQFAWQFDTDGSVTAEGVYIDDIVITGIPIEPAAIPSAHELEKTLRSGEKVILSQPTSKRQFRTE